MDQLWPYLGDLHRALPGQAPLVATVLISCSLVCGIIVGLERERKNKPAGLRTVALIATGSTIFTLASVYGATDVTADRTRIAGQVVTGIGFLGAGAIIRDRGRVIGLTTGATIWVVAAIGLIVGMGYAAGGLLLSVIVILLLVLTQRVERLLSRPCQWEYCRILFDPDRGKTRIRLRRLLDRYHVPPQSIRFSSEGKHGVLELRYCTVHSQHRMSLARIAALDEVVEVQELKDKS